MFLSSRWICREGSPIPEIVKLPRALGARVTIVTVTDFWSPVAMANEALRGKRAPPDKTAEVVTRTAGPVPVIR